MDLEFDRPTFRFAPSPNGLLHIGHAFSALLNDHLAREHKGRFLLRLEDIDRQRCREEFVQAIKDDLRWLGLDWEKPVRRQSEHFSRYGATVRELEEQGLVYPCFCTRGDIRAITATRKDWPTDPDGVPRYPGPCRVLDLVERRRQIGEGRPFGWRLDVSAALRVADGAGHWTEYGDDGGGAGRKIAANPARWGDVMIARKDVPTSYHLAVIVDDAIQGVTDVVRGRDLFAATDLHRLLQRVLGLPEPRYHHHRLILDEAGRKLSKSRQAPALGSLREAGVSALTLRSRLGF